jgi:hypothetical protein
MQASFEFPMKLYLASLFGRRLSSFRPGEPLFELLSKTPEQFMNLELAHMRFNYGPGVLGKLLLARSKHWSHPPQYVVVSDGTSVLDCRALGRYFLVQVMRDKVERVYPFVIPNADMRVRNDGTVEELGKKMEEVADKVEEANAL